MSSIYLFEFFSSSVQASRYLASKVFFHNIFMKYIKLNNFIVLVVLLYGLNGPLLVNVLQSCRQDLKQILPFHVCILEKGRETKHCSLTGNLLDGYSDLMDYYFTVWE